MKKFIFYENGRKREIKVQEVPIFSTGLMFKRKSPPLLWDFGKERKISIHSFFCMPFTAIWINKKKKAVKTEKIKKWKISISGFGRYLLEAPKNR